MTETIALVPYEDNDYAALATLDLYDVKRGFSARLPDEMKEVDDNLLLYTVRNGANIGGLLSAQLHVEDTVSLNALFIDASLRVGRVLKAVLKGFIALCRQGGVTTILADVDASTADYMKHAGFTTTPSPKHPHRLTYTID